MDAKNGTALLRASQHCQPQAIQLLLDHGAAVDQMLPPVCNFKDVDGTLFQQQRRTYLVGGGWNFRCFSEMILGGGFLGDEISDVFGRWLGDLYVAQECFQCSALFVPRCWVTPLVFVVASQATRTCGGERQLDVIRMLLKNGAKKSYRAPWQSWDSFNHFNRRMSGLF